jgi:hypothetical protein
LTSNTENTSFYDRKALINSAEEDTKINPRERLKLVVAADLSDSNGVEFLGCHISR